MEKTRVFVSYSWDSDEHKAWVRKFADELEEFKELHVVWDGYDLDSLSDKNHFMESGISSSDYVIVIATREYKRKADERIGGVGIETYLTTAAHWQTLLTNKHTKVIVAARDKNSTPSYLAGQLYIDFSDHSQYQASMGSIVSHLRGTARLPRPHKKKSLLPDESLYSFTKVEELIKVNHTNRRAIVDAQTGTDFSGGNRIKYELWETRSPAIGYFLALANNINISQTIDHAIRQLRANNLRPTDLTILRPKTGRPEQTLISGLFAAAGFPTSVHEYTYKDYIWEFCIDETLKRADPPTAIPHYTDQSISIVVQNGENETTPSALDYFTNLLQGESPASAHLVVAPGGMGKTSLCLSVSTQLHNRTDLHSSVILIQAEAVKKYVADQGLAFNRIDSIYQLYELYGRFHDYDQLFDRPTFDLAVLCGNLVVIIDGLDEFTSLFHDRFNLDSFLTSLRTLHEQLGSSRVLLTTRNSLLIDDGRLNELKIAKYELLGFDANACEKYINRRFRGYQDQATLVNKVLTQIEKVRLHDIEKRVVPFFADIAATVVEDELRERKGKDFEVQDDPTPYPSNNDLTDHIIHSVLRREETRHGLDISVREVVHLISGLVVDYGKRWPASEMKERLELLYDARGKNLFSKLSLSPLLVAHPEEIEVRYSFLNSYFEVIFVLDGIISNGLEKEFIRSLGRLTPESSEFRELKRFFLERQDELNSCAKALVSRLKAAAVASDSSGLIEKEPARKAIASLLNLYAAVVSKTMAGVTERILDIYGVAACSDEKAAIDGLFICGDFPALDFTNLTVTNSRFHNYRRLLASRFRNTRFLFTSFENCGDPEISSISLDHSMIDPSCEIGDLREILDLSKSGKKEEALMVIAEATKFLHSFFRGDRFIDNNRVHVRFSNKVPGLSDTKFDRLIANGYMQIKRVKEVDTFYEIADAFRPSVRRLLTNNYPDAMMKDFLQFIRT